MTLLLGHEDVAKALTMEICIDTLREFFRELAQGRVVTRPRTETWTPLEGVAKYYKMKSMEGSVPFLGVHCLRIDSDHTTEVLVDGVPRQKHLRVGPGNTYTGLLFLFDHSTGVLQAIMPDGLLARTQVGALYAIAADRLARAESRSVGLFGTGWQAGSQIAGLAAVRKIERLRVYSPNPEHRSRFASEMRKELNLDAEAVDDPRDIVCHADIVVAATNSGVPVFDGDWIESGTHINSVRNRELDERIFVRANLVVVNRTESWITNWVMGDKLPPEVRSSSKRIVSPGRAVEALDFFTWRGRARFADEAITLFPNEAIYHCINNTT
jgi:ornithine cyclodeaminase/alanine dehydrogenase-like protein (mu-crystallin family)